MSEAKGPPMTPQDPTKPQRAEIAEILPTKILAEKDFVGTVQIKMQHQGHAEPFTFIPMHYDYRYTSTGQRAPVRDGTANPEAVGRRTRANGVMMTPQDLPPLPEPQTLNGCYTLDQMRSYALAAVEAARPKWLPIETAPKDGTMVLVNDTTPWWTPWVAASYTEGDEWSGWVYDDATMRASNPLGPNPTHWMPLPAAPSQE
jgi:hypothetical protein